MNHRLLATICLLLFSQMASAQNENSNWYFGNLAGINFSSGTALTNNTGVLSTREGCAAISNGAGQLLFYTDGSTVYNNNPATGNVMPNGTGLLGNSSSSSSAIIVPDPCSETLYYVFTVDFVMAGQAGNGVNYSLVEMDDNGDCRHDPATEFGMVLNTAKNIPLPGPTGERIAAAKHANGEHYWVVATQHNTNNFYVYEISDLGLNTTPSLQAVGTPRDAFRLLKFSPDGTQLALSDGLNSAVYLYDFDNATGLISNERLVGNVPNVAYGVEFSPDGTQLFYSDWGTLAGGAGTIYQADVATLAVTILATVLNGAGGYACGALQLTPESPQRILVVKENENNLDAITFTGGVVTYVPAAVPLAPGTVGRLGLPTFVSGQVSRCRPLDFQNYRSASPDLFSTAIKTELDTDGFSGMDKEYGDLDNDGDIDLLFTKVNVLHYFENTGGYCNAPAYPNPSVSLGISDCYSFRLYDWDNANGKDLVVFGTIGGVNGIFLFLNNGSGGFPATPSATLLLAATSEVWQAGFAGNDFPFNNQLLIEAGDLNGDALPDLLIGSQNNIQGMAYFENAGGGSFNLVPPQNYTPASSTTPQGFITNCFLDEYGGSYPAPIFYDADCTNGLDILVSDPLTGPGDPVNPTPFFGGGRMVYYENLGVASSGSLPNFTVAPQVNQFGFNDLNNNDLRCDWVITRIVDFFNDNCPIAISYNPCSGETYFYYQQGCICSNQNFVTSVEVVPTAPNTVDVFPNPTREQVQVVHAAQTELTAYRLYSVDGQLIGHQQDVRSATVDLSAYAPGLYFISLRFADGSVVTRKIVKE